MKNKNGLIFILIAIIIIVGVVLFVLNSEVKIKEFNNNDIEIVYDTTWKVVDKKEFTLKHKKSKSTFKVVSKELESNYYDTSLDDMIKDIVYDIQSQNKGFVLINTEENISEKYEGYSYLYEKGEEQVLVNIYKKDNKLVIAYYSASNEYYDIVLDSVDAMLDSLKIKSGV
jgi:frataxin-like iron-binding protein CyaY